MKYLNIALLILIIFIINPEKSNAQTPTPSNLKADSLLSQMPVSYPFSFVVMGDCQPYDGNLINEIFVEILSQIDSLPVPPTFVIICGDLTECGSEEGYLAYSESISVWMDTTGIPLYSLPGNHEFYGSYSFEYYMTYIDPEFDYYFDYGNSRFIAINNVQHPDSLYYHITGAQLDSVGVWLSTGPENKFAFNHVSIIRNHHGGGFNNTGYPEFHDSLRVYEAVADFNGHHHDYYRHDKDGIYYLTTAGAGGNTAGSFYPPLSYDYHHWLLITVDELNNISLEMYFFEGGHNATASLYDFQIQPMQIPPIIYINEFMASNNETIADPQGDYDDWIEIYNADIYPVDIGGMYITDDLLDPAKWKIPDTQPDSTTIQPGEFLLLWADEDIGDGVLHLDIKLSANGEEIGLYTDDLTSIIDSIVFGAQTTDISFGRHPDGSNNWGQMNPTPGSTNDPPSSEDFIFNSPLLDMTNYPNPFNPSGA
ncbi:MAG: lamin tail domain-containing protein, partial [Candidatus Cloacimonetes bacterium]|nr:lamin tail domain-containing protein [Candidatus Cloacimonadota bacterium]